MKKILLLVVCLLVVGCNFQEEMISYDLGKLETEFLQIDPLLKDSKKMDQETLLQKYNFDTSHMEEFLISLPTMTDHANMYMVVKPKKGKSNEVKEEIQTFFETYQLQFSLYYPEEENKIKERLEKEQDGYLFYFVSEKQNEMMDYIKQNKDSL